MQLRRLGPSGQEKPALVSDGVTYRLEAVTDDVTGAFLADDGIGRAAAALAAGELPVWEGAEAERIGAPIARPEAVICIGQNYAAHAAESGAEPPTTPIVFFKHPNTVVGPHDEVPIPPRATKVDWEVELGVVIGKRASYLEDEDTALDAIAGYVTSHDVSERDFQIAESGGQWSKGKCAENFNPVGPALVPAAEIEQQRLRLWSSVNGEARQGSTTADMVFTVAQLVHHLSQYMVLSPGDLINTGTPQGVGLSGRFPYLADGDVVELGIEGLGEQRQRFVQRA
ncbi:fumarylacetoacetate hydrolase family protein [Brachybacterium sacelli]|uniref:2-keto-4-pentenoate hydratase/2-oxohepta-3-ene-1,7-dioic acid hydratase in catechol pathway n=1 Tax=Brachybacterium sacelli TaxID=173364 RepID=A0ABS4WXI2_9MICO|nr:fumarylacetoacetate hydrolase family protein [Brachybacterium sacelli]MBP2380905.1 2-keto-4-pentenoate hydratase/2-oxohepta-3-ene-1,7-dioic acid hydratase in catechol pathway [Brachybacterium sacelli]